MSGRTAQSYLAHMRQAALDARGFVATLDRAAFESDKRTQQAVVMSLTIIGEAATRIVSEHADFAEAHPDIPWQAMRGMRNRLVHGYFEIDLDVVWNTVSVALVELLERLDRLDSADDPTG